MPFGLKNAGATYQRLVNLMLQKQIGHNMEVYIDDLLVKTQDLANHITDLAEAFNVLQTCKMILNQAKCIFSVSSGKFLGFLISKRGIEANLEKIKAILDMQPPKNIKELQ